MFCLKRKNEEEMKQRNRRLVYVKAVNVPNCLLIHLYIWIFTWIYTGCPRRNVKYFGRAFLMLNYTDITENTYIQS